MSRARAGLLAAGLAAALACGEDAPPGATPEPAAVAPVAPQHVGVEVCAGCHERETALWRGSHHDLAMQVASADTVLGDFADSSFTHRGERFDFERRDGRFIIRTADADGERRDFEVAFTFGVEPLQQYLVAGPGGRLQAVGVAWDTRPSSEGGQRWFHLQPDAEVPPGDVLHWTGLAGSWNAMCADCHSTNVAKGYRPAQDAYRTTWSEIDVACEACHGPGSAHVAWAQQGADPQREGRGLTVRLADERAWRFVGASPIARRVPSTASSHEIESCAPCHARRSRIASDAAPGVRFLDAYHPALLDEGLYHADGQILDEVYVWGSFLQSRMYAAGVSCGDCHDPHALRIEEPDAVCAGCHRSETFATPEHHHHAPQSAGASCVACHMPERTYMQVDARRDHSLRVPRPDLGDAIGVPDACSSCHAERSAAWAAQVTAGWYGSQRSQLTHYGEILDAGRRRAPGAARALASLSRDATRPAIVRATALRLLAAQLDRESSQSALAGLRDESALVRLAAVAAAEALPPLDRRLALQKLLRDPVRSVRIEAARALAPLRRQLSDPGAQRALAEGLAEYRAAQRLNGDRPESHVNLGILDGQLGELDAAQREYEAAIRLGGFFVPAYVNLADLHRARGREQECERVLREGLRRVPDAAALQHALGLSLARQQRPQEALEALARASELAPEVPRYAYVHGVALHAQGDEARALSVLEAAQRAHPEDAELLLALATVRRDAGDREAALRYARRLLALRPQDPSVQALVRELEAR